MNGLFENFPSYNHNNNNWGNISSLGVWITDKSVLKSILIDKDGLRLAGGNATIQSESRIDELLLDNRNFNGENLYNPGLSLDRQLCNLMRTQLRKCKHLPPQNCDVYLL